MFVRLSGTPILLLSRTSYSPAAQPQKPTPRHPDMDARIVGILLQGEPRHGSPIHNSPVSPEPDLEDPRGPPAAWRPAPRRSAPGGSARPPGPWLRWGLWGIRMDVRPLLRHVMDMPRCRYVHVCISDKRMAYALL